MRHRTILRLATLLVVLGVIGCASPPPSVTPSVAPSTPASPPPSLTFDWHDPGQTPVARAEALLAEMSIDEKIGQMTQLEQGSVQPQGVADLFLGSVLSGGGGCPSPERPRRLVADGRRRSRRRR